MPLIVKDMAHLESLVGKELGVSEYRLIEQSAIDFFAQATGDHQWIHVDPVRAASGPFGKTIAHGFMTLSLIPVMMEELVQFERFSMALNYGCNKVRFMSPVLVGSHVRLSGSLVQLEPFAGGVQIYIDTTIEIRDASKPACIAQSISRLYL